MTNTPANLTCKCGHFLHTTTPDAACPECGQSVATSMHDLQTSQKNTVFRRVTLLTLALLCLFRDGVWTFFFATDNRVEAMLVPVFITLPVQLVIIVLLFFAQPRISRSPKPIHAPEQGVKWCIAATLMIPVVCLLPLAGRIPAIPGFLIFILCQMMAWYCAMSHAQRESEGSGKTRLFSPWSFAIALTAAYAVFAAFIAVHPLIAFVYLPSWWEHSVNFLFFAFDAVGSFALAIAAAHALVRKPTH